MQATAACARRLGGAANAFGTAAVATTWPRSCAASASTGWTSTATRTAPTRRRCSPSTTRSWCGRSCSTAPTTTRSTRSSPRSRPRCATPGRRSAGGRARATASCARSARSTAGLAAHPLVGRGRDADGYVEPVHLTPAGFAQLVVDATYTYTFFRDLPGALRAYRHGDRAPMLRLAAEDVSFERRGRQRRRLLGRRPRGRLLPRLPDGLGRRRVGARAPRAQLNRAIAAPARRASSRRSPSGSGSPRWTRASSCAGASSGRRRRTPTRRSRPAPRPHIPVLVLDGEFDQATPVGDARMAAAAWPDSTYVQVANTGHISALDDYQRCASGIVRTFLTGLAAGDTACAARIPAVNAVRFPAALGPRRRRARPPGQPRDRRRRGGPPGWPTRPSATRCRAGTTSCSASTATACAAAGSPCSAPYASYVRPLVIRFHGDRFVSRPAGSRARATWNRDRAAGAGDAHADRPRGRVRHGSVLSFPTNRPARPAVVTGTLGGRRVHLRLPAPWTSQGSVPGMSVETSTASRRPAAVVVGRRGDRRDAAARDRGHLRQARVPEPVGIGQGPPGPVHDRARRERGPAAARRHDRRGVERQHRQRDEHGGGGQGLPHAGRHARGHEPRAGRDLARARRRRAPRSATST